jgi:opacity protein-like surface antigen
MNRFFVSFLPLILIGSVFAKGSDGLENKSDQAGFENANNHSSLSLSQNEQPDYMRSSIFFQFNTSGLYPALTDWKNELHLSDGTHPSGTNIVFGAEAGCVINRYIQGAIGYEFFFTTKTSTIEATGDQINSTFFYGSFRGNLPLESIQNLSLFGSIDVGSLSATEVMENYYGHNFNKTGSTTAYRLMIGSQYYMTENWSIMASLGYFEGKVKTVTVDGQTWPNFSLDFSGPVLRFAVNYHIPLY